MITQVRVNEDDPAFNNPSKPIGKFFNEEQAKMMEEKYGYIMKEDAGRGYRRVVASPKPAEIIEIGTIRTIVESGDLVIAAAAAVFLLPVRATTKGRQRSYRQRLRKLSSGSGTGCRLPHHSHSC